MSWIGTVGATVVKLHESSLAMLSGGSLVSWSVTFPANMVAVPVSLGAKSLSGSGVKVLGPPLVVAVCEPLTKQEIENQLPVTLTGSLNVTLTFASSATSLAPLAGERLATEGAVSAAQLRVGERRLRGVGAPTVKSPALLSVSVQPFWFRSAAVVLLS